MVFQNLPADIKESITDIIKFMLEREYVKVKRLMWRTYRNVQKEHSVLYVSTGLNTGEGVVSYEHREGLGVGSSGRSKNTLNYVNYVKP